MFLAALFYHAPTHSDEADVSFAFATRAQVCPLFNGVYCVHLAILDNPSCCYADHMHAGEGGVRLERWCRGR